MTPVANLDRLAKPRCLVVIVSILLGDIRCVSSVRPLGEKVAGDVGLSPAFKGDPGSLLVALKKPEVKKAVGLPYNWGYSRESYTHVWHSV